MTETTIRKIPLVVICILIGIVSGFAALLFYKGMLFLSQIVLETLLGYHYPVEGESILEASSWCVPNTIWLILPILIIGAFIAGLIVWKFAPETAGPGTDQALKAYHTDGKIRWRVPIIKAIASILTIGSGGSAGCEGPMAHISSGIGAIFSDIFKLSPDERKIAIAVGIGAGVGAIFKAPIGGAILAAEILYLKGMKFSVILPALLASFVGYAVFGLFEGFTPLFGTTEMSWTVIQLPFFVLLGIVSALIGLLFIKSFYGTQKFFEKISSVCKIPMFLKPVIGAAILGLIVILLGYLSPETCILAFGSLGTGYGFVQLSLYGMLPLLVLLLLPFLKIIATSLTIGSGGSGGIFAPGLSIGAFTGGAVGLGLHLLFPDIVSMLAIPVFILSGMIATFGGISHAPIAIFVMVIEMTWSLSIALPALLALIPACILLRKHTLFKQQRISEQNPTTLE